MTTIRTFDIADMVDTGEAARILGVHRSRVLQLVRGGDLEPAISRPKVNLFTRASIDRLAAQRRDRGMKVPT